MRHRPGTGNKPGHYQPSPSMLCYGWLWSKEDAARPAVFHAAPSLAVQWISHRNYAAERAAKIA